MTPDEPLRLGARRLFQSLRARGHELWIYTTSFRSPSSVKLWLWSYGIRVKRVVNQHVHDRRLSRGPMDYPPSKNPRAFDIDLHVDDLDGVRQEGEVHGFRVVVVSPSDEFWVDKVLAAADAVRPR